jgi:very-short-patch-repair endonuclease
MNSANSVPNIVIGQPIEEAKAVRAKQLRREMTLAERLLWNRLRSNRLRAFHFRRQQIIDGFIIDF